MNDCVAGAMMGSPISGLGASFRPFFRLPTLGECPMVNGEMES